MTSVTEHSAAADLLDRPVVGAADVVAAEDGIAALLGFSGDVVVVQAEAIVALEACARSLGRPGLAALNVTTGPYGALFGRWLAAAGADVTDVAVPFSRTVTVADLEPVLAARQFELVAVVHAEAATGGANPMDDIAALVAAHGALLVVDAVASVGAHRVDPQGWAADVVVIGPQKALAGPAGVSALAVSERAWEAMRQNGSAPRDSILSLLDLKDGWLATGRAFVLGTPSSLETAALNQALARVAAEGLDAVIARHRRSAAATRAGLRELGLQPWIVDDRAAAGVVTTVAAPARLDLLAAARVAGARLLTAAPGSLAATTLRINHTGRAAQLSAVLHEIDALATGLGQPAVAAVTAAEQAWEEAAN